MNATFYILNAYKKHIYHRGLDCSMYEFIIKDNHDGFFDSLRRSGLGVINDRNELYEILKNFVYTDDANVINILVSLFEEVFEIPQFKESTEFKELLTMTLGYSQSKEKIENIFKYADTKKLKQELLDILINIHKEDSFEFLLKHSEDVRKDVFLNIMYYSDNLQLKERARKIFNQRPKKDGFDINTAAMLPYKEIKQAAINRFSLTNFKNNYADLTSALYVLLTDDDKEIRDNMYKKFIDISKYENLKLVEMKKSLLNLKNKHDPARHVYWEIQMLFLIFLDSNSEFLADLADNSEYPDVKRYASMIINKA
jgi:hypothetical protein